MRMMLVVAIDKDAERAPAAVVQQERARLADFAAMLQKLEAQHARLG